jgi:hypothetical protein
MRFSSLARTPAAGFGSICAALESGYSCLAHGAKGCWQGKAPGIMAKVLGESGRYVSQEATKRLHAIWTLAVITMAVVGSIGGFTVGSSFRFVTLPLLSSIVLSVALILLMWLVASRAFRRMDELEKERESMRKGAAGEKSVAHTLSKLPDEFRVVNDVQTPIGNLDHVVIGPTGVFVIETKNWRGIIDADGKGELTWNGKGLKTTYVKKFLARVMETRKRVQVLAPGLDAYFKGLIVFTSAWVGAKFGTTGRAYCIRDDRLVKYIMDNKPDKRLSAQEVELIAHAFASLARMDPDFCAKAQAVADSKTADAGACALGELSRA